MNYFLARLHVSPYPIEFVGYTWQEGGFSVDESGNPVTDPRGNTVATYLSRPLRGEDAKLLALAYAGEDAIGDGDDFSQWLAGDCACSNEVIGEICAKLGVTYSVGALAGYREAMALKDPMGRLIDLVRKS